MASRTFEQWWDRFVQTGDICPLKLGQERREVEALFGRPDDFSTDAPDPGTAAVWKYNDLELHFGDEQENRLTLIYMDSADAVLLSIGVNYGRCLK